MAVALVLQEWHHWLEGSALPFIVWTGHRKLVYLCSTMLLTSWQVNWALFLGCFDFTLTYHPGSLNRKPDALSHQFSDLSVPILPSECIVCAVTW